MSPVGRPKGKFHMARPEGAPVQSPSVVALPTRSHALGDALSVRSVDLSPAAGAGLPVLVVDDFRVGGHPFGPHPHAGFSAVTCVFEDSPGALRSRDSLGNDIVVGPGGVVWTQAGSGAMHEELPAQPGRELHGLQVFVNLPARLKLTPPCVMHLDGPAVPVWRGPEGDRVRIVSGAYTGIGSPLRPAHPLDWLDLHVVRALPLPLPSGHLALLYVVQGELELRVGPSASRRRVGAGQALMLEGTGQGVELHTGTGAHAVWLGGAAIDEPVVGHGPFMMSDEAQLEAAMQRYRDGGMGRLVPVARPGH